MERKRETHRRIAIILLLMFLPLLTAVAQEAQDAISIITGRVIDGKTHKPMAYVSVSDKRVGTVTNEQGEFTLKVKGTPGMLSFSCVGYRSRRVHPDTQQPMEVAMMPATVRLSEIIVQGADAKELVRVALSRINKNYPQQADLLRGFYRETIKKRSRFISISEAVVDVYKSGYQKMGLRDAVSIEKGRRMLSQKPSDTLAVKLMGGPVLPVQMDVIKNTDILIDENNLDYYTFSYRTPQRDGDRTLYVIEMQPFVTRPYPLFSGTLYIDQETLAFTKVEIELDMTNKDQVTRAILQKRPLGLRFTPHEMSFVINYKTDEQGVTRINYMRNIIRFRCDWKRKVFKSNFTVCAEMVVTDWREDETVKPIRSRDSFNRRDSFYDKVIFFDDPDFWGTDNIIEPTESLEKAVKKLRKLIK